MMDERVGLLRRRLAGGLVIPACPLALTAERRFDERHQRALIRYYRDAGAGGLAVGVHTTQFAIHDPKIGLYRPVLELAATQTFEVSQTSKVSPTPRPIMVAGLVGDTAQACREATLAVSLGYDCGLLSLAALHDADDDTLLAHCRAVAEIIPLFGFYLQPAVGGRVLPYSFWRRFAEIERVVAIKIAPFNRYQTLDVVRAVADSGRGGEIALYTGNDDHIVEDLLAEYRFARTVVSPPPGAEPVEAPALRQAQGAVLVEAPALRQAQGAVLVEAPALRQAQGAVLVEAPALRQAQGAVLVEAPALRQAQGAVLVEAPALRQAQGAAQGLRIVGGLLGHWAVWTRRAVEILAACHAMQGGKAQGGQAQGLPLRALASQITDCNAALFDAAHNFAGCIAGIHEVLRRQGLLAGRWLLDPHEDLSPGQAEEIDRVCVAYPHLNDDEFVRGNLDRWLA